MANLWWKNCFLLTLMCNYGCVIVYVNIVIVIHNSGKNRSFSLPLINPLLEKRKEAVRPPNVSSYPTGVAVLCELKISSSSSL